MQALLCKYYRKILRFTFLLITLFVPLAYCYADAASGVLPCRIGSSLRWGSSWCDLQPPKDFVAGSTVEVNINPDGAQVVLVRFLAQGSDPNEPLGIVGGKQPTKNGKILLKLEQDYKNINQISVHGGPGSWNYDLGQGNKGAMLQSISVMP